MSSIDIRDPYLALRGMWRGGQVEFRDQDGVALAEWKVEQLFRDRNFNGSERVLATRSGLKFAYAREAPGDGPLRG
jgi:hypothetical protein